MAKEKTSESVERIYIIPLRASWLKATSGKKTNRSVNVIKEFISKHMKVITIQ